MITILIKERPGTTPWCQSCAKYYTDGDGPEEDLCASTCQGYIVNYFRCPYCQSQDYFYGFDEPKVCDRCGFILPSITLLKNDNPLMRLEYHLEKEKL